MFNQTLELLLILLLIFTPIAFGAMDLWAASLMESAILFMIVLYAIRWGIFYKLGNPQSTISSRSPDSAIRNPQSAIPLSFFSLFLFGLFLCLILFQMLPLPPAVMKAVSPRTYEIRHFLLNGPPLEPSADSYPLSFGLFATEIQFLKWLALIGLFVFLRIWDLPGEEDRRLKRLVLVVFLVGVFESLYGMFEVFSGHNQSLTFKLSDASVAGTFISRNILAGYLLMVIPLSTGFLLWRERGGKLHYGGWRHRLSSLDGKTVLLGFGIIVMVLALLFSASRMGITSLFLSITVSAFLFRSPVGGKRISKVPILILGLALLWAAWIGLDAVAGRFLVTSEDFGHRWAVWLDTARIVRDFPLFGTGLGTFWQVFPMYRSFHLIGFTEHAENDFLQLASEAGLIGMGFLLILFASFFYKAVSGVRSLSLRDPRRYVGMGGLVGILALMFHSLVEKNIQIPSNVFLFTFIFALALHVGKEPDKLNNSTTQ